MSARDRERPAAGVSRRRFVALAGVAALSSRALAATATTKSKKPAASPAAVAHQKEYERQRTGTLAVLKTLRAYPLPPGGDLPVVFRPLRAKRER